jgi:hypothetical protein
MAKVKFGASSVVAPLTFDKLGKNESFRIATVNAQGAVYRKVLKKARFGTNEYFMMEEATGELFEPTRSPVELVDVEVNINTPKPKIY